MSHNVKITIENSSDSKLKYLEHKFYDGCLEKGSYWPKVIEAKSIEKIMCCSKFISVVGCSGWAKYELDGCPIYFCFSNPMIGENGIEVGSNLKVFDKMGSHYSDDVETQRLINLEQDHKWLSIDIANTSGMTSYANYTLKNININNIEDANIEMKDVHNAYCALTTETIRKYYRCDTAPTAITGLIKSHFKGLAFYKNKIIFTHTNMGVISNDPGKYLIANNFTKSVNGQIEAIYNTEPKEWSHPCSSQACGSFMAMGIEKSANGNDKSEIHIYDIRNVEINQPAKFITKIERNEAVNGVAITKETTLNGGKYIVAAGEGKKISIYRSSHSSLFDPNLKFSLLYEFDICDGRDEFNASGSGLALITQTDGSIFLISLNDFDSGGKSRMNLYKLNMNELSPEFNELPCQRIDSREMPISGVSESVRGIQYRLAAIIVAFPIVGAALSALLAALGVDYLNSSFRWGKGLRIISADRFEVYATDRNVLPLSQIPFVGSSKDFSLVIWNKHKDY
ncbi:hypothetical protein RFI02_17130 [Acinetobacter sichuanensis]|uniref:hypothetical protein n=1 Tax=Acinetobacter sichuanensis TaxID=2136183 RepID=UPI00280E5C32|nr:hypothetical protein [Acinetobacter sichuanensis]MDQ9022831.1 hypothetical protein [Acinetobacter sichuanensis]